jgi:RimJ/RimL family protein N-acetyltransferase
VAARDALAFRLQAALLDKPVPLPAEPITDGVVILRRLRPSDAQLVHAFSHEDPRAWLAEHDTLYDAGHAVDLGVAEHGRDGLCGLVQLQRFDWPNRRASVGLWLVPQARGRGLMTRSLGLLVRWVFEYRVLDRIEYLARADNERSLRLALRCGFEEEGRLRSCLVEDRRRHDAVLLAAVAGEWDGSSGAARGEAAHDEGDGSE